MKLPNWFKRKPEPMPAPARVEPVVAAKERRGLSRFSVQSPEDLQALAEELFKPYQPPKGVRGDGTSGLSMDSALSSYMTEQVQVTMQVNLFGPASSNQMQMVTALWRDMQAVDFFRASGLPIAPLTTSTTRQLGFETGERQYDDLWTVDLTMQVTLTTRLPQQFATSIPLTLEEVVTAYPATE